MPHNLDTLTNEELLAAYGDLIALLKERKLIRTKNVVGDIGEFLVLRHYNSTPGLPRLSPAPANTENHDATDPDGKHYSIKSTTVNRSGCFHFDEKLELKSDVPGCFDFALIAVLSDEYRLKLISCFTWKQFVENKRWSKRQKAWFLPLTKRVLAESTNIFSCKPNIYDRQS
jgi:hypothetical protein